MEKDMEKESKITQFSEEEKEIINDIRQLKFGRVLVIIQDGAIISKEITKTIKIRNKNNSYLDKYKSIH
jgi:hypothetical protein